MAFISIISIQILCNTVFHELNRFLLSVCLAALIVMYGYSHKSLSISGAIAAFLVGCKFNGFGDLRLELILVTRDDVKKKAISNIPKCGPA